MMTLKLCKEIYSLNVVLQSKDAFSGLAEITISTGCDYWTCCFTNCKVDASQTIAEFENYAIDLMNANADY